MNLFKHPSPTELAKRELLEAQEALLAAQSAHEYAGYMASYHQARIERLTNYLNSTANL